MNHAFLGFVLSALYGILSAAVLWYLGPQTTFAKYHEAFFVTFNCAIAGGLVATTAILVRRTQSYIPQIIEEAFTRKELTGTDYFLNRAKFQSMARSLAFSSSFAIVAFTIFFVARFPFTGLAANFLIAFGCMEYALGVYIGRKLFYIAQMLRSIDGIPVSKDIFQADKLAGISTYVNAVSTMTAVLVFVGVRSYYYAPFEYGSIFGTSVRAFMLLPAIIAIPVLALFNYYPRTVVRHLYEQSISHTLTRLRSKLKNEALTDFERLTYLVETDKVSRDELKYRLRMTLTDLPMAVTLALAVLSIMTAR